MSTLVRELTIDDFSDDDIELAIEVLIQRDYFNDILRESHKQKRRRTGASTDEKVSSIWQSTWGKLISNPNVTDPDSFEGNKFRRRFRVPYPVFKELLVPLCHEKNIFNSNKKSFIPTEFKVLIALLALLGRNNTADHCCEGMSGIGESTCNSIFKAFIKFNF